MSRRLLLVFLFVFALPLSSAFAILPCEDVPIALDDNSPHWIPVIAKPMSETVEQRQQRTIGMNFGLTSDTATIRLIVSNSSSRVLQRDVVFDHPRVERVNVVIRMPDGTERHVVKGGLIPGSRAGLLPGYVFPVAIPAQGSVEVMVSAQAMNGALVLPLAVAAPDEYGHRVASRQMIQVCLLSVILAIGIFLVLSNIISLDTIVGRAGMLLCAVVSYQVAIQGWFDFFLGNSAALLRGLVVVTGGVAVITATAFLKIYFSTENTYRKFHTVLTVIQGAALLGMGVAFFDILMAQRVMVILGGASAAVFFVAPVLYWRSSRRSAILHLTAWALPSVGFVFLVLRNMGLMEDTPITSQGHLIGTAIGAMLFAAIVKDRQVEVLRQSAQVVMQNEARLAELVHRRTAELEDRNQQLSSAVQALFSSKVALEQANQTKNNFLANMSHELRTPLNAINGYSEMIVEEYFGPVQPPRYREYARHILTSGHHLLSVINDLLDLSRIEAGRLEVEPAPFNLVKLAEDCAAIMFPRIEQKKQRIVIASGDAVPPLVADHRLIRQVVLNLLGNASKYSPDATTITVRIFPGKADTLHIEVIDQGMGIAEEAMPFIFEPFRRGEPDVIRHIEGVGLGLPICKRLIEIHSGHIEVFSRPGEGTRVLITLPRGQADDHAEAAIARQVTAAPGRDRIPTSALT